MPALAMVRRFGFGRRPILHELERWKNPLHDVPVYSHAI